MAIATSTAIALASVAAVASAGIAAGTSISNAKKQAKTAKAALASQEKIAQQQIESAKEGEVLASQTAKHKLKLKQASQTKTILTSPLGVSTEEEQINETALGV